jgi:hypothetical protein
MELFAGSLPRRRITFGRQLTGAFEQIWREFMQAIFRLSDTPCLEWAEQRGGARADVALPILIDLGRTRYSALLHNLSITGAMVETRAPLVIHSKIEFHCGSICTTGYVLRQAGSIFGIKFSQPISDRQLSEQVSRSKGVTNRRENRAITA